MFKFQHQSGKKRKSRKRERGITNRGKEISHRSKRDFKSGQGLKIGAGITNWCRARGSGSNYETAK